jgi:transcription termination factor Rho
MSMAPQALERSVLERKERDELAAIAEAMGVKPASRASKATLIDQILREAGIETGAEERPKRTRSARSQSTTAATAAANGAGDGRVDAAGNGEAAHAPATTEAADGPAGSTEEPASSEPSGNGAATGGTASDAARAAEAVDATTRTDDLTATATSTSSDAPSPEPGDGTSDQGEASATGSGGDASAAPAATEASSNASTEAATSGDGSNAAPSQGQQTEERPREQREQQQRDQQQHQRGDQRAQQRGFDAAGEPGNRRSRRRRGRDRGERDIQQDRGQDNQQYSGELIAVEGLLDLRDEGYGFLRTSGYLAGPRDAYVSLSQVRRFALRKGDYVQGASRPAGSNEKYPALLRIDTVNGMTPDEARGRPRFEDLTPLFPDEKLRLEIPGDSNNMIARIVDLVSPIGKGQRGLIVSPPKAGKTTVLKQIAHSIEANNPEVKLIVLLVDERPEEVTDFRRSVKGDVVSSTFDRPSDEHTQVAELTLERAKRLVELGKDVVIVLDGITRLARAYNLAAPATGRIMSGGIDTGALYPPKRFFGAARNIEEGGSITILATALVETGSKMDEVIFEEFKGTGNMELKLDRKLAERRIYPALDVNASSTRHEELLFDRGQLPQVWKLRRVLNALEAGAGLELLMDKIRTTKGNDEFLAEIAKAPAPAI